MTRRFCMLLLVIFFTHSWTQAADHQSLLDTIRRVQPEGMGHRAARDAVRELSQLDATHLPAILAGMDQANPLAENWIRGAAEAVIHRAEQTGQSLPWSELETFLGETQHNPKARSWVYDLIRTHDPQAPERLIPTWLNDPSLPLRREAVNWALEEAEKKAAANQSVEALELYRQAFTSSRDLDQIQKSVEALKARGETPDVARHMGFVLKWKVIGPFDNRQKQGFAAEYPPEKEIDLAQSYRGKASNVAWQDHTTSEAYGTVDLNTAIGKHMGAVAYAYTEFWSAQPQDIEIRVGSPNGTKVWLNGELLLEHHVYHANALVDQYVGRGRLKAGRNEILVKIAQNEQTEDWAQAWLFQLRVCDSIGTAVLSQDRDAESADAP